MHPLWMGDWFGTRLIGSTRVSSSVGFYDFSLARCLICAEQLHCSRPRFPSLASLAGCYINGNEHCDMSKSLALL